MVSLFLQLTENLCSLLYPNLIPFRGKDPIDLLIQSMFSSFVGILSGTSLLTYGQLYIFWAILIA